MEAGESIGISLGGDIKNRVRATAPAMMNTPRRENM
jgi:hypothetical protein